MTRTHQTRRIVAGALALLVALMFSAPPAGAAEPTPAPSPTPQPTLAASVDAALEAMPSTTLAAAAQAMPEPARGPDDSSFFKSGKGVAVLALLAGGLGYTIYSFSHDRVKSPNH